MIGLEAAPKTHSKLIEAPVWARAPKNTVNLLNIAGDVRPGLVNFSECAPGVELCHITGTSSTTVRAESIDHFLEELKIGGREIGASSQVNKFTDYQAISRQITSSYSPLIRRATTRSCCGAPKKTCGRGLSRYGAALTPVTTRSPEAAALYLHLWLILCADAL